MTSSKLSRRAALALGGAACAAPLVPGSARLLAAGDAAQEIAIQSAQFELLAPHVTEGLVSTRADGPPPVIRMRQNEPFRAVVRNTLPDYTAMHWHGLRVPNGMDGVPYLTQIPMGPGDAFEYSFTSPDAGTFWYHPHCMTMDQMALGLTGVLVVDEAEDPGFNADIALNLRDFRLDGQGRWIELWTARGAARGGTFGTVMTANWLVEPTYDAPAGGLARIRCAATDTTRTYRLFVPDAEGVVLALDGHPLVSPVPLPKTEDATIALSPGQRADLVVRMPDTEGAEVTVMTDAPGAPRVLARLRAVGATLGRDLREVRPLPPNPVADPDLSDPRFEEFVFGWSPEGDLPDNGVCGTLGYTFWSINRRPWPGDAAEGVGPLATFRLGESVVLRLRNESPNNHPIHLHGLVFKPLRSNKRALAPHWTDTVLLEREETVDIAFVADNPGDGAFHCHVIEHQ
ncbi:MAG: multicopper oxidase family protein [Pseudomonadota bacterium]